eukprot:1088837-Amphidinium_carterae.1
MPGNLTGPPLHIFDVQHLQQCHMIITMDRIGIEHITASMQPAPSSQQTSLHCILVKALVKQMQSGFHISNTGVLNIVYANTRDMQHLSVRVDRHLRLEITNISIR